MSEDTSPDDALVFRTSRGMTAVYIGFSLLLLLLASIVPSIETEGGLGPCAAIWCAILGILLVWSAIHLATQTKVVTSEGLAVKSLLRSRRYPWSDLERWGVSVVEVEANGQGSQKVWMKYAHKFLSVTFCDFELASPGFDQFIKLLRQYAGEKERHE